MKFRIHPRRSFAAGLLVASVALVGVAGPAAAAVPDRGSHGAQAQCRYKSVALPGWTGAMRLNRMTVLPPSLYATETTNKVGWRLLVQRRYDGNSWKRIFASGIQKAPATQAAPGALTPISALIDSPLFVPDGSGGFHSVDYRVVLKFYWFAGDGSVERLERHRVGGHDVFRDGLYQWTDGGSCSHGWIFP